MKRTIAAVSLVAVLAGCATNETQSAWAPHVDQKGINQAKYDRDLTECQAYAKNTKAESEKQTKKDAIKTGVGAGVLMAGAAIATGGLALLPMMAGTVLFTGGATSAVVAGTGNTLADQKYRAVVINCLHGRGYSVLD